MVERQRAAEPELPTHSIDTGSLALVAIAKSTWFVARETLEVIDLYNLIVVSRRFPSTRLLQPHEVLSKKLQHL